MNRREALKGIVAASASSSALLLSGSKPSAGPGPRQPAYVGAWSGGLGNGAQRTQPASSWSQASQFAQQQHAAGRRLVSYAGFYDSNTHTEMFAQTWGAHGKGSGAQWISPGLPWQDFKAKNDQYANQGLRLVALSQFNKTGQTTYAGAWSGGMGNAEQRIHEAVNWNEFAALDKDLFNLGFRMVARGVSYDVNGETVYASAWRKGLGNGAQRINQAMEDDEFGTWGTQQFNSGLRLVTLNTFFSHGKQKFIATYGTHGYGSGAEWVRSRPTWNDFANEDQKQFQNGRRLVAMSTNIDTSVSL